MAIATLANHIQEGDFDNFTGHKSFRAPIYVELFIIF